MWTLHVKSGLHEGSTHELQPGLLCLGATETSDVLLLDDGVPERLIDWFLDENGTLECRFAASDLQFSYDNVTWTVARAEPLFGVDIHYRLGDVFFTLIRTVAQDASGEGLNQRSNTGDQAVGIQSGSDVSADKKQSPPVSLTPLITDRMLAFAARWPRIQNLLLALSQRPRLVATIAAAIVCVFVGGFWAVALGALKPAANSQQQGQSQALPRHDGLMLSYQLSLGHQAPPGAFEPQAAEPAESVEVRTELPDVSGAAGVDTPEPASHLKISSTLTMGKPVLDADKSAEPALYSLQERLEQYPWGARVTVNARGRNLSVRAFLSEAERRDFERLAQALIREHGNSVVFKAFIEPLEPPTQLAVKQVLGGANPMIILQDGSRLMPGSLYDGKIVESITTDRVVLRGKDRVEIPI